MREDAPWDLVGLNPVPQHSSWAGTSPQHQWGEEQDIPGEPLWGRAPHFSPLIDHGEVKQQEPSQACVPRGELALQIAGSLTTSAYYSLLS